MAGLFHPRWLAALAAGWVFVAGLSALRAAEPATRPAPNRVTFRDDQTVLVNGRPFFPVGFYYASAEMADPTGKGLDALRAMGINMLWHNGPGDAAVLDRVAQRGMYVWWRPPGAFHQPEPSLGTVRQFRTHPAVLFWELEDEPVMNKIDFEQSKKGAEALRAFDPDHPLICTQWPDPEEPESAYRPWADISDVSAFDWYPVPLKRWERRAAQHPSGWPYSIAVMGRLTQRWRQYSGGKPVFVVLQAFTWDAEKWGRDGFPSVLQGRFMAYQAVINGAKGLSFYGRVARENPPATTAPAGSEEHKKVMAAYEKTQELNAWFWTYYPAVVREVADMAGVFAARDAAWKPEGLELMPGPGGLRDVSLIESRARQIDGGSVLLLVNSSDQPAALRFRAAPWAGKTVHIWREQRTLKADAQGVLADRVEPFGVRIYSEVPAPVTP